MVLPNPSPGLCDPLSRAATPAFPLPFSDGDPVYVYQLAHDVLTFCYHVDDGGSLNGPIYLLPIRIPFLRLFLFAVAAASVAFGHLGLLSCLFSNLAYKPYFCYISICARLAPADDAVCQLSVAM